MVNCIIKWDPLEREFINTEGISPKLLHIKRKSAKNEYIP